MRRAPHPSPGCGPPSLFMPDVLAAGALRLPEPPPGGSLPSVVGTERWQRTHKPSPAPKVTVSKHHTPKPSSASPDAGPMRSSRCSATAPTTNHQPPTPICPLTKSQGHPPPRFSRTHGHNKLMHTERASSSAELIGDLLDGGSRKESSLPAPTALGGGAGWAVWPPVRAGRGRLGDRPSFFAA